MKRLYFACLIVLLGNIVYSQDISVPTYRYENHRVGWNPSEKKLNTSNVGSNRFGLLFTRSIDDQMYAQPLLISNLMINEKKQNVLFVVTMSNSVYAFNADDPTSTDPLWHVNVTSSGSRVFKSSDLPCSIYGTNIGIISTPVIDTAKMTMYLINYEVSTSTGKTRQLIHAIDITTGNERAGSPQPIAASVPGTGQASVNDTITFDPHKHNQRAGLLLYKDVVYACWASFCDYPPYHGWVIGFDANTLKNKYVYNVTPQDSAGGIWMAGNAPSVDDSGYVYIISGNGTVGLDSDQNNIINRGESLLKFHPGDSLKLVDFFTPGNYKYLENNDLDYGIGGAMLIPNTTLSVSNSKEGSIFLLDDNKLGKYSEHNDSVIQKVVVVTDTGSAQAYNFGTPVYYRSTADSEFVYVWGPKDSLKQFLFNRTDMRFDLAKTITGNIRRAQNSSYGPVLTVSSDSSKSGTGIVWSLFSSGFSGNSGVIEAFDARDVRRLLWSSSSVPASQQPTAWPKFNTIVVANGKVYVPSQSKKIYVYGLTDSVQTNVSLVNFGARFSSLYPNPTLSSISLDYSLPQTLKQLSLEITDIQGRLLMNVHLAPSVGSHSQTISLDNTIKGGVYVVVIRSDINVYKRVKLIKY